MKYVKLTDPPQKVRMAAMGGGTCLQFPGFNVVPEGLRGQCGDRRQRVAETARVPESLFLGSWKGVPEPDPDRADVDGALVDLFALVVTGGDGAELA